MIIPLPISTPAQSLEIAYTNLTAPVAHRITRMRMRSRLTRHDLAVRLDSTDAFVSRLESGGPAVTATRISKVAKALGVREELFYPRGRPDLFWRDVADVVACFV